MTFFEHFDRGFMRLGSFSKNLTPGPRKEERVTHKVKKIGVKKTVFTREEIAELFFENCIDCGRMAAIPQGAFAACKVRRNLERNILISPIEDKEKTKKENIYSGRPPLEGWELTPLKYNSKLMNSIWGLYNRYSVHNFKKNTDSNEGVPRILAAVCEAVFESHTPAAKNSRIMTNGNSL